MRKPKLFVGLLVDDELTVKAVNVSKPLERLKRRAAKGLFLGMNLDGEDYEEDA